MYRKQSDKEFNTLLNDWGKKSLENFVIQQSVYFFIILFCVLGVVLQTILYVYIYLFYSVYVNVK